MKINICVYRTVCQSFTAFPLHPQTHVIFPHLVVSNIEENFPAPGHFLPERWLKSDQCPLTAGKKIHPFVSLPFGYGRRTCIGRRFAEAELHILLAKVCGTFQFPTM
jgi:cytochrome P450 family 49 subfamily A